MVLVLSGGSADTRRDAAHTSATENTEMAMRVTGMLLIRADANAVSEDRLAACRDVDEPRCRTARRLLVRLTLREDLPIAGYRLDDQHVDRVGLSVAQRDLVRAIVYVVADDMVGRLPFARRDVEGIAHMQADALVPGRVFDPVGAHELRDAARIRLVQAHEAA